MTNIELYKQQAKEILIALGETERSDNIYDDNAPIEYSCEYNGYGLDIAAYHLSEHLNTSLYKNILPDIIVCIDNSKVLDTKNNIYIPGVWEEIFKELHKKLPILKNKKEEEKRINKYCKELYDNTIMPLVYRRLYKINDSIEIKVTKEQSNKINNCGTYLDDYYYNILVDGKSVYKAIERGTGDYEFYGYVEGPWENELREALVRYEEDKIKEREEKGYSYLKELRNLK